MSKQAFKAIKKWLTAPSPAYTINDALRAQSEFNKHQMRMNDQFITLLTSMSKSIDQIKIQTTKGEEK